MATGSRAMSEVINCRVVSIVKLLKNWNCGIARWNFEITTTSRKFRRSIFPAPDSAFSFRSIHTPRVLWNCKHIGIYTYYIYIYHVLYMQILLSFFQNVTGLPIV